MHFVGHTAAMAAHTPIPEGSPTDVPTIRLDTITLRPITFDDINFVEAACADEYVRHISSLPYPCTQAAGREFIERQHQRLPEGSGYPLVIEPHEQHTSSLATGFIGVWFRQFVEHRHLTIGYWSIEAARGQGYMGQALRGLSDWAFDSIDCDRHRLWIEAWNIASQKTGERAGFVNQPGVRTVEELHGVQAEVLAWDRERTRR